MESLDERHREAQELIARARRELAGAAARNAFVELVEAGAAPGSGWSAWWRRSR